MRETDEEGKREITNNKNLRLFIDSSGDDTCIYRWKMSRRKSRRKRMNALSPFFSCMWSYNTVISLYVMCYIDIQRVFLLLLSFILLVDVEKTLERYTSKSTFWLSEQRCVVAVVQNESIYIKKKERQNEFFFLSFEV